MKKILISTLSIKFINFCILGIHRVLSLFIPEKYLKLFHKIPVIGNVKVYCENQLAFLMRSDGKDSIAKEIYWTGLNSYEPRTLKLITHLLKHSSSFYDIGANTGLFSLLAGSMNNIKNIYSFEPLDSAYKLFEDNVALNSFKKILLNKIALSNFDGESTFNINLTDSSIPLGASLRNDVSENKIMSIVVKTAKLDTFIINNNISSMDLLKIDTEGTEDLVLEGGMESIEKYRPIMICEVLSHTKTEPKLHKLLDDKKYLYYYVDDDSLEQVENIKGDPYIVSNYLLMPSEKADELLKNFIISKIKEKIFIK